MMMQNDTHHTPVVGSAAGRPSFPNVQDAERLDIVDDEAHGPPTYSPRSASGLKRNSAAIAAVLNAVRTAAESNSNIGM